ncbi:MAG: DUF1127 domain-containing protein [Tistlia sp.]|uniref:DUF1127 domain-containing protein n=1 Tax=Tistlia sp. TaxID=3057121 RepID=UPI0034A2B450
MTTIELHKSAAVPAPAARSLSSRIAGLVELLFQWQERWEQRERLSGFDEHLLRDIGLSRADAVRESSKPFWRI